MNRGRSIAAQQHDHRVVSVSVVTAFILAFCLAFAVSARAQDEETLPEPSFDAGYAAYQHGNFYEARMIWQVLAEEGDARALYNLGTIYAQGRGVTPNMDTARDYWNRAASAGHVRAMHNLALSLIADAGMRDEGQADEEYDQALELLQTASAGGFPNSQYTLGKMYQYGLSVPQNDEEAARLFMEAANQGYANAQYNLGKLYRDGRGVPRDEELSIHYFELAALQGHAGAQNRLATRYARGEGVEQNDVIALMWASLAAEQGDERAGENRDVLLARMSEREVAEAQALIDASPANQ